MPLIWILAPVFVLVGVAGGYVLRKTVAKKKQDEAETKSQTIIDKAKTKHKEILLEAKDKALKITEEAKTEENERRKRILHAEERIEKRENQLDQKYENLDKKSLYINQRAKETNQIRDELDKIKRKQIETLEKVADLSRDRAKEVLMEMVEKDIKEEIIERVKKLKKIEKEEADKNAQKIVGLAIERYAQDQSSEMTATTVSLPSDEMKGRIIGREGRNIKRIEELTGIEIVVDDTPEAIVISGFNPIRRHIAKRSLEKLIHDGRIHPAKIEETITKVKNEIAQEIKEAGEATVYDLGIADFDPKLVQLIGRLKFRTSYGQNVLNHSIEVANLAAIMAEELHADVGVAKRAGILHDIGKSVDHEIEGTHIEIGKNILKKFGVNSKIIHAVECHHGDMDPETAEASVVAAADAISGSRIGARKDSYENYIKRLEELENVATTFDGVERVYAVQAGREVRVFVTPDKVDDLGAMKMAREIATKIEKELKYPGEIRVNVIRETRIVEYAR